MLLIGSAGLAAVLLVIVAIASRSEPAGKGPTPIVYAATPVRVDGLAVSRTLTLSGREGTRVEVQARITNEAATPVDTVYEEVVPKSLAASVDDIRFRPAIDTVVERDPVVQYRIELDPGEVFSFRYNTNVPGKGLSESRLTAWDEDQAAAVDQRRAAEGATPPIRLVSLVVKPGALTLPLSEAFRLEISGVMDDQSAASQALLAGATVRSSQPSVVEARGVTVIGARKGKATITVQAGRLRRSVPATVGSTAGPSVPSSVSGGSTVTGAPCTTASTAQTWSLLSDEVYADESHSASLDLTDLVPGQKAWVVINVRNTGDATWCRDGANPVMLGTEAPRDRPSAIADPGWFSPIRPALLSEVRVPPDGAGTFEFPIVTPTTPGPFSERFNLVVSELAWFDDIGYSLDGVVAG